MLQWEKLCQKKKVGPLNLIVAVAEVKEVLTQKKKKKVRATDFQASLHPITVSAASMTVMFIQKYSGNMCSTVQITAHPSDSLSETTGN